MMTVMVAAVNHWLFPLADCPQCYDLVQEQVNIHRGKLRDLTALVNNIGNNPSLFNDSEFLSVLGQVNNSINVLLDEARGASSEWWEGWGGVV